MKILNWIGSKLGRSERTGGVTQKELAEKALRMKEEAGPQTNIPGHRTGHEGGVGEPQMNHTDTALGKEATYTANLKRSHNAKVGDTGKTTGQGRG